MIPKSGSVYVYIGHTPLCPCEKKLNADGTFKQKSSTWERRLQRRCIVQGDFSALERTVFVKFPGDDYCRVRVSHLISAEAHS